MSDIFISYASEDRAKAETLAYALEQQGWSVWWDRTIPAGKSFDEVITEALAGTRCVVALWSRVGVLCETPPKVPIARLSTMVSEQLI